MEPQFVFLFCQRFWRPVKLQWMAINVYSAQKHGVSTVYVLQNTKLTNVFHCATIAINLREVPVMTTVYGFMRQSANCCANSAAAGTSAGFCVILDTALLAVSIFICLLVSLLII